MKWILGFLVISQVLSADLYDRNERGLDWRRDGAYSDRNGTSNQRDGTNNEWDDHDGLVPGRQPECPCDPDDPECPCQVDSSGVYHRVD